MRWADAGDEVVVPALRAGDEAAFAWLVRHHDASLHRVAVALVGSDALAADVVQETWLAVIGGLDRFEGRSTLRTWIFGILENVARSRRTRERRAVPFSTLAASEADRPGRSFPEDRFHGPGDEWPGWWATYPRRWDPEERLHDRDVLDRVCAAVNDLPPTMRVVISLRDVDGWPAADVCAALGLSNGNQRVLLHRARARVRAALDEYLEVVDA